jgi:hypothetical protein
MLPSMHAESLRLFRSIATMDTKAPLPSLVSQKATWRKAATLAGGWDLKQLAKRLDGFASSSAASKRQGR